MGRAVVFWGGDVPLIFWEDTFLGGCLFGRGV